jgi:hypothetical protein
MKSERSTAIKVREIVRAIRGGSEEEATRIVFSLITKSIKRGMRIREMETRNARLQELLDSWRREPGETK